MPSGVPQPGRDRLTPAQKLKVLELLASGMTKADVARRFCVSDYTIIKIQRNVNVSNSPTDSAAENHSINAK